MAKDKYKKVWVLVAILALLFLIKSTPSLQSALDPGDTGTSDANCILSNDEGMCITFGNLIFYAAIIGIFVVIYKSVF